MIDSETLKRKDLDKPYPDNLLSRLHVIIWSEMTYIYIKPSHVIIDNFDNFYDH